MVSKKGRRKQQQQQQQPLPPGLPPVPGGGTLSPAQYKAAQSMLQAGINPAAFGTTIAWPPQPVPAGWDEAMLKQIGAITLDDLKKHQATAAAFTAATKGAGANHGSAQHPIPSAQLAQAAPPRRIPQPPQPHLEPTKIGNRTYPPMSSLETTPSPAAAAAHLVFGPAFAALQQRTAAAAVAAAAGAGGAGAGAGSGAPGTAAGVAGLPPGVVPGGPGMTSWWAQQAAQMYPNHVKYTPADAQQQGQQGQQQGRGSRRLKGKARTQPHVAAAGAGAGGAGAMRQQWQGYGKGQIIVAPASEHICATEYWESMAGPEALLPDDHLLAATAAQLKDRVDQELAQLEDEQKDARDRCRLAHVLGNLALTPAGDELYHHDPVYPRRFFRLVKQVHALYAQQFREEQQGKGNGAVSSTVVPRPCVAGYAMLALGCLVKREAQERWFLRRLARLQRERDRATEAAKRGQQQGEQGQGVSAAFPAAPTSSSLSAEEEERLVEQEMEEEGSVVAFLLGPDPFAVYRAAAALRASSQGNSGNGNGNGGNNGGVGNNGSPLPPLLPPMRRRRRPLPLLGLDGLPLPPTGNGRANGNGQGNGEEEKENEEEAARRLEEDMEDARDWGFDGLGRLRVLWRMLVHLTREARRSRGALRSLALNLELLTSLELAARYRYHRQALREQQRACKGLNRLADLPSLLDLVPAANPDRARLQISRAAELVLRFTGSRADACAAAQALYLFGAMTKAPRLYARGQPGYQAFTAGKGIAPIMRALGSLGTGPEDAMDRLSLLACASDLGPAHPQLALPGAPQLLRWATYDEDTTMKHLERERAFATLGLARIVDPATVAVVEAAIHNPRRRVGVPPAEPAVLELYPQGPEWEKEAEANAVFLGGLAAIDVVVDRVREYTYMVELDCIARHRRMKQALQAGKDPQEAEQEEEGEEEDSWLYGLAGAAASGQYDDYGRPIQNQQAQQPQQTQQQEGNGGGGCQHRCTCKHEDMDSESDSDTDWEAERVRSLMQVEAIRGQPGYREDELGGKWVDGRHAELVAGSLSLLCHLLAYHEPSLQRVLEDARTRYLCVASCASTLVRCFHAPDPVRRVVGTQCVTVLAAICTRSFLGLQLMRQFPGILQAIRRFLLLEGTPALATAVHTLIAPPVPTILIVPSVDPAAEAAEIAAAAKDTIRPRAPHTALRLAVHLATLCEVTDVGLVEEAYPSLPTRPATQGLATGAVPAEGGAPLLPASSVPSPRWLERLGAGVLTHRGVGCLALPPSQAPAGNGNGSGNGGGSEKPGGWGWTPEGMARALRALVRSVAMREQGLDMGPLQVVFRAGGSPALLGCLLAPPACGEGEGDGNGGGGEAEAKGVEAAAARAAAGVPPLPPPARPVLPGRRKQGSKRKRAPEPEVEGAAVVAVPEPTAVAAAVTGCSWCGKAEGQGEGGGLLRCGRCKEARYCSRECQCRHWKQGGHRKDCRPPAGE